MRQARRWLCFILCAAAWIVLAGAPVAHAAEPSAKDHESAKELFRAGRAAYERGDFRAAAASFEEAARLAPHPQAWYAAGEAWDSARDAPRAVYALERSIELPGLAPSKTKSARRRLARLTPKLGIVQIDGPPEAAIALAHVRHEALPTRIHVLPGEHQVHLVQPASATETKTVVVEAGQTSTVAFDLPEPEAPPPPPPPPAPVDEGSDGLAIAGWTLLGIGLGGSVAAAVITSQGLAAQDQWEADLRDTTLLDRAESLRTWTVVAWIATGTVALTGVTLLVVDAASDDTGDDTAMADSPSVSVRLGPLGGSVVGRW